MRASSSRAGLCPGSPNTAWFSNSAAQRSGGQGNRGRDSAGGAVERNPGYAQGSQRGNGRDSQAYGRDGRSAPRGNYDRSRSNDRYQSDRGGRSNDYGYRGGYRSGSYGRGSYGYRSYGYGGAYGYANGYAYSPYYYAPRALAYRYAPRHYYGSGGHLSIYFGIGSGYLYGSAYSGRIYGYRGGAASYGGGQYYGDIRLDVNPPDAEVYVDGYYAGIVDDFDGQYQRLALEAGPHKIEIGARGLQSQVFDVYVDPSRTVELRADLLR